MENEQSFYAGFPALEAMETNLNTDVANIKASMADVKNNPRYADNEAERNYQLEELNGELENTLASYEDRFQFEVEATEAGLAQQAFEMPRASEQDLTAAKSVADTISQQVIASPNVQDTLALLATRVKSMSDVEKSALALQMPAIKQHASNEDSNGYINQIQATVQDTAHQRDIKEQLELVRKIKSGGSSLRRQHDIYNAQIARLRNERGVK